LWQLSVLNGVVAGVAEVRSSPKGHFAVTFNNGGGILQAFDVYGLDDNLTLPVIFGFGCWFTMWSTSFFVSFQRGITFFRRLMNNDFLLLILSSRIDLLC
jgi:hypothetical protein